MSFPDEADPNSFPIVEWLIDGVWTDVTDYVRGAGSQIDISRGRQNEQGTVSPTTCSYTMNGHDGEISNRNPRSSLYRKIPTGIQTRTRAGDGDNYVHMRFSTQEDFTSVSTPDKAALDVTGDIEVRVDVRPFTWRPVGHLMILASKWQVGGDARAWVLYMTTAGRLVFVWTPDGTYASRVSAGSTANIPATSGRLSVKVTLDVNNGAGGWTVNFATSSSVTGTYTALGSAVTGVGVTSIASTAADLVIGGGDDTAVIFAEGMGFGGHFHGLHLYNGIGGTLVADPAFTGWGLDNPTYTDPKGNVWSLLGQARVSSPRIRFWGELTSATQDSDLSVRDVYVPITNADILERLGTGRVPAESSLYLNIRNRPGILGYWPCEDGADATVIASATAGVLPGAWKDCTPGQTTDLAGSRGDLTFPSQTSSARFRMKKGTGTSMWTTVFFFRMPDTALPALDTQIISIYATGYPTTVYFQLSATGFRLRAYGDTLASPLLDTSTSFGTGVVVAGEWIGMRIKFTRDGANIDYEWAWYQQGSDTLWGVSGTFASSLNVGTPTMFNVSAQGAAAFEGMRLSHVVVSEVDLGFASDDSEAWNLAIDAYARERAAVRIRRVMERAGIYLETIGNDDDTPRQGPQPIAKPLDVALDSAKADGGIFAGLRDAYGVVYITRQALERRRVATLSYDTDFAEVPKSTDDGVSVVNAFTLTRSDGSSAYVEITDGPNSIADAPDGIGLRPGGTDANLYTDENLVDRANLYARAGSADQARIPNLAVAFHRPQTHPDTTVGAALMGLDIGGTVYVDDWPDHLPPDALSFLAQGYTESLWTSLWSIRFNTTQALIGQTGMWTVADQAAGVTRWGSTGTSSLDAGITSSATTLVVASVATVTTVHVFTSVSARYPLDVMIGGEQIRLNNPPGGSTSPQTFTGVTRAVNGISKAHDAGAGVSLYVPTHYGLGAGD